MISVSTRKVVVTSHISGVKNVQTWSFFLSLISSFWTEYGNLQSKSPFLVQMQENVNKKILQIQRFFILWLCQFFVHFSKAMQHSSQFFSTFSYFE